MSKEGRPIDMDEDLKKWIKRARGAAKGAFGGAIKGAISGHGVGRAVDYMKGESQIDGNDQSTLFEKDKDSKERTSKKRTAAKFAAAGLIAGGAYYGAKSHTARKTLKAAKAHFGSKDKAKLASHISRGLPAKRKTHSTVLDLSPSQFKIKEAIQAIVAGQAIDEALSKILS